MRTSVFSQTKVKEVFHINHKIRKQFVQYMMNISAVSCFETIKQGYDTKIIVCYRQKSELMNLAKIINQIIPRLVQDKIELEFFESKDKTKWN